MRFVAWQNSQIHLEVAIDRDGKLPRASSRREHRGLDVPGWITPPTTRVPAEAIKSTRQLRFMHYLIVLMPQTHTGEGTNVDA